MIREGLPQEALAALETAVELGLRQPRDNNNWQQLVRDYYLFKEIRKHPRFVALLVTLEADMSRQRAKLAARLKLK